MTRTALVAMPKQKIAGCDWDIPNVNLLDWDTLNKGNHTTIPTFDSVIACPYYIEDARAREFVKTPVLREQIYETQSVAQAVRRYLRRGGFVIFLVPTWKYFMKEREGFDPLDFIEYCIAARLQRTTRCVLFEKLKSEEKIKPAITGAAGKSLVKYLDKRAPKNPQYQIILRNVIATELAYYNDDKSVHAATRVIVGRGGIAVLLPFDDVNVDKKDVELLVQFQRAMRLKKKTKRKQSIRRPASPWSVSDPKPDTLYMLCKGDKARFQVGSRVSKKRLSGLTFAIVKAMIKKMNNDILKKLPEKERGFLSSREIVKVCGKLRSDWRVEFYDSQPKIHNSRIRNHILEIRKCLDQVSKLNIPRKDDPGYRLPSFTVYRTVWIEEQT